jgi:hypothetical protein
VSDFLVFSSNWLSYFGEVTKNALRSCLFLGMMHWATFICLDLGRTLSPLVCLATLKVGWFFDSRQLGRPGVNLIGGGWAKSLLEIIVNLSETSFIDLSNHSLLRARLYGAWQLFVFFFNLIFF